MKPRTRPEQIDIILNSLDAEMTTQLETYIADLEAKQPDRPPKITKWLKEVAQRHSTEAMATLEAYLSQLEANQQPVLLDSASESTESLYWRSVRRKEQRRVRAQSKHNEQ